MNFKLQLYPFAVVIGRSYLITGQYGQAMKRELGYVQRDKYFTRYCLNIGQQHFIELVIR